MKERAPVKFFIIDSDSNSRNILANALNAIEGVVVAGQTASVESAYKMVQRHLPDIVMMDYDSTGGDVKKAIADFKRIKPSLDVILISVRKHTSTKSSELALELGALYFIWKPSDTTLQHNVLYYTKYLKPVIDLYRVNRSASHIKTVPIKKAPPKPEPKASPNFRPPAHSKYELVAIGSSLGGPEALKKVIPLLPADFPVPIVITQHMPEKFTASLAASLDSISRLFVIEAQGGETLRSGYVYLAPGGRHMIISRISQGVGYRYVINLRDGAFVHGCKPAVDVMFKSIASSVIGNVLAVVLTGMGKDGAEGVRAMKKDGRCFCVTQNRESCVVYGMPGEVAAAGLSDLSLPLNSIAVKLTSMVKLGGVSKARNS
ncbi:MAG: response regulator [candidate division Zixibacteria bacterium]|nr:response regulator [candidate division Zixibacteria bacterium]